MVPLGPLRNTGSTLCCAFLRVSPLRNAKTTLVSERLNTIATGFTQSKRQPHGHGYACIRTGCACKQTHLIRTSFFRTRFWKAGVTVRRDYISWEQDQPQTQETNYPAAPHSHTYVNPTSFKAFYRGFHCCSRPCCGYRISTLNT